MRAYREPPFLEPLSSTFIYVAWSVDPVRVGPFVRPSDRRRRKIDEIRGSAGELTDHPKIEGVRLFEVAFMPPLPDIPKYDVVMLARARSSESAAQILQDPQLARTEPTTVFLAANGARFGVAENGTARANILLNHFVGPEDRSAAVTAWRAFSGWFTAKMGVDNSTLLRTEDAAPYVLVNYVRLPATVVGFLLNQLLRPSFHRYVRALLKRHQMTSLPLFVMERPDRLRRCVIRTSTNPAVRAGEGAQAPPLRNVRPRHRRTWAPRFGMPCASCGRLVHQYSGGRASGFNVMSDQLTSSSVSAEQVAISHEAGAGVLGIDVATMASRC